MAGGWVRQVISSSENTGPTSVSHDQIVAGKLQRIRQAQSRLVYCESELHKAHLELETAQQQACTMLADYGIIGTIGQSEPQE